MIIKILTNSKKGLLINKLLSKNLSITTESSLRKYDLNSQLFKQILTSDLLYLSNLFIKNNFELRIAGGAVRDLLMEKLPSDIDLATNALPNQMLNIFKKENVRVLNLNGLKHGTVPVRISDQSNYEITTLRIDVKTFGRHAEVEFTSDWHLDSIRRDLTVNALFLDLNGTVYDYVNGVDDLRNKIVRFVGNPDKRVKEDYLRILRYFRFYSRIRDNCDEHDSQSIKAIRENVDGLEKISGERIGYELRKIISQKFSDSFIKMFKEFNMNKYLGLPIDVDVKNYKKIYDQCFTYQPNPFTLLHSIIKTEEDINNLNKKIKLSNNEKSLLQALNKYENQTKSIIDDKELLEFLGKEIYRERINKGRALKLSEAIELLKYIDRTDLIDKISKFEFPKFIISVKDILSHKFIDENTGKLLAVEDYSKSSLLRVNYILSDMRNKWIDSNFSIPFNELLNEINSKYLSKYISKKN